jgi:hypothetical protein
MFRYGNYLWRALLDKIICLLNLGFDRGNISFALVLLPLDSWNWALIFETYILPWRHKLSS